MKFVAQFFIMFFAISSYAQSFEIVTGPISGTISDSRSVNFLDINNDGWEDIYISNGLAGGQKDFLYINDGTGQMIEITDMEIVQAVNPSDGASFADFNNDGHVDGVISSWYGAEDLLYLNNGSAVLNYHGDAGIAIGSFAETATFGDYDNDGWLDLYITSSGDNDQNNYLYRNLQNGKFERITNHILVSESKLSRGAIWTDINCDGFIDLFVANESNTANDLFYGTGNGNFEKLTTGFIVTNTKGSITASWGDIDNDGDFDLFVGNTLFSAPQTNQIFINHGNEFELLSGDPVTTPNECTYGSAFGDYDNDGDLDLVIANGFCNSGLINRLYKNQGNGTFIDATGEVPSSNRCSFGIAWGDIDNDGFLDLMTANCKNTPSSPQQINVLLRNLGNDNNWLDVKLIGVLSNKSAIGAKVRIKATIDGQPIWQIREIRSQSGYAGQNSLWAHFGLKDAITVDSLIVTWPAGGVQTFENVAINQKLTIEESITNSTLYFENKVGITLSITPNPLKIADKNMQLTITNKQNPEQGTIYLTDTIGQLIKQVEVSIPTGSLLYNFRISSQHLTPGMYYVNLQIKDQRISKKVVLTE